MEHKDNQKVKRGEIYLYDFGNNEGSIQNGIRPVLIVQCDEGNQTSTTTVVAALTTAIKKRFLPSHIILGRNFGLDEPSMGLAPLVVEEVFEIIKRVHGQGTAILLVEQNARQALKIADYGYVLELGEISIADTASNLLASEEVQKAYLGG